MGQVTKVLLLLAVVVPVTAYVAGSLASPGAPAPPDHRPVILRDAPTTAPVTPEPAAPRSATRAPSPRPSDDGPPDRPSGGQQRGGADEARVVTPQPTPVGEDDDDGDDGDDGGPDDDTDDGRDDDDDGGDD